jgi:hypothetical protein
MLGYEVQDGVSLEEFFHGRMSFLKEEIELAKLFVLKSSKPERAEPSCPVCETLMRAPMFVKWGLPYFLCGDCWTIVAPAVRDVIKEFETASPVTELRRSRQYQDYALKTRKESWRSLSNWMRHRLFRYLGRPDGHAALARGVRYAALVDFLLEQSMFSRLDVKGSIVVRDRFQDEEYDVLLYLDVLQSRIDPRMYLEQARAYLRAGGLLFLTARVGTGFDVLSLRERGDTIYPYEHVFLPSVKGLRLMLEKAGFDVLEISTPGMFDAAMVFRQRDALPENSFFLRYLTDSYDVRLMADFQKLLQKHNLSSSIHIVAKKQ